MITFHFPKEFLFWLRGPERAYEGRETFKGYTLGEEEEPGPQGHPFRSKTFLVLYVFQ